MSVLNSTFKPPATKFEAYLVRELRRMGYEVLRNEKLHGYCPDILLPEHNLIIEVDGSFHDTPEQQEHDEHRTRVLSVHGYTIMRVRNGQIEKSISTALRKIQSKISAIGAATPVVIPKGLELTPNRLKMLNLLHERRYNYRLMVPMHGIKVDFYLPEHKLVILIWGDNGDIFQGKTTREKNKIRHEITVKLLADGLKISVYEEATFEAQSSKKIEKILTRNAPLARYSKLANDPNWEALACKKLGIDPAKPKRIPING